MQLPMVLSLLLLFLGSTTTSASCDGGRGVVPLVAGVQSYQSWSGVRICHFLSGFQVRTEARFARSSFKKKKCVRIKSKHPRPYKMAV
jgi:hypothetical protein